MRVGALVAVAVLAGAAPAETQVAYRVKDLATAPVAQGYWSAEVEAMGDLALLAAGEHGLGYEPFVSDGTPEGMHLLRDIAPGAAGSYPRTIGRTASQVFFAARDPAFGEELWRTDGTAAGTVRLGDLAPGAAGSTPRGLGALGTIFLFAADDGVHGRELWRSDGTVAGTWRVADLAPGEADGLCPAWGELAAGVAGRLLFCGDDGVHGAELWASDGATVWLVADLAPAAGGSTPRDFLAWGGRVYFAAADGVHGRELWASDGSAAGTVLVADLVAGSGSADPLPLASAAAGLVFCAHVADAYCSLWGTDGTATGTTQLADVEIREAESYRGRAFATFGGRVVFFGRDAAHGLEPWSSDGTVAGTAILGDLNPGPESSIYGALLAAGADGVWFCAYDAAWQGRLWRTDGTPGGTAVVAEIPHGDEVQGAVTVGGTTLLELYWWSYCPPHHECDYYELWRSDGSAQGTSAFRTPDPLSPSSPDDLTERTGGIGFKASNVGEPIFTYPVFVSDGTEAGTLQAQPAGGGGFSYDSPFARLADGELLVAGREDWGGIWRTDGALLTQLAALDASWEMAAVGDLVFFIGDGRLWISDGTVAGTSAVGGTHPTPEVLTPAFDRVWFMGYEYGTRYRLWESRGTAATTLAHDSDLVFGDYAPLYLTPLEPTRGTLLFQFRDGSGDLVLYALDPETDEVAGLHAFGPDVFPVPMADAIIDGVLLFVDAPDGGDCELWRTDGTVAGTARVRTIGWADDRDYPFNRCPETLVAWQGRVWFQACDRWYGCEPWVSDGTWAGTRRFADLQPSGPSSSPRAFAPAGDRLYFSACRSGRGCEPWLTDGTPAGTHRLADIAPGPPASEPDEFTRSGDLVFFRADDGTGSELWAMAVEIFYDGLESGDFSRWSAAVP